jgi:hypothetical protein
MNPKSVTSSRDCMLPIECKTLSAGPRPQLDYYEVRAIITKRLDETQ